MQYIIPAKVNTISPYTNKTGSNFISLYMLEKPFQAVGDKQKTQK